MQLIPYLIFPRHNCEEALKFYGKALGGATDHISRHADAHGNNMDMAGEKIMQPTFVVDGDTLFPASDGPLNVSDSGMVSLSRNFTGNATCNRRLQH